MTPAHLANLALHIGSGALAMGIGFVLLARAKGTPFHRRWGRIFGWLTGGVCLTAAIGELVFRFTPLFATLTVLASYQLAGGWRAARTRDNGPGVPDAVWTLAGLALTAVLVIAWRAGGGTSIVMASTLGALALVLTYDLGRWLLPRRWFAALWRYEHAYKLISSLFAMLSAFVGNVIRMGQPWSQLAPSAVGVLVIGFFFHRISRPPSASPSPRRSRKRGAAWQA